MKCAFESSLKTLISIGLAFQQINKIFESDCGLSIVQWSLLKALIEMPTISPQALAKTLGVSPSTLTQTLARLSKRKLIFVCDDPRDARRKIISITRSGKEKLEEAHNLFENMFGRLYEISTALETLNNFLLSSKKQKRKSNALQIVTPKDAKWNWPQA